MPSVPYQDLYIYEVEGDARAATVGLGPDFLGLWLEDSTSFLFFSRPSRERVERMLAGHPGLCLRQEHELDYQQWQGGLELEPLELEGLIVVPAWRNDYRPPPGREETPLIRLDPGLVFGSGLHPTTRHCLELLLERAARGPLGRVLDLGCGTGILALAAARLGAGPVWAVDLNPLCVQTTRANARLNGLELAVHEGPAHRFLGRPAQVVMANLPWTVMSELMERPQLFRGKMDLILSGVTRSHVGALHRALGELGFAVQKELRAENTWFSLWAVSTIAPETSKE